MNTPRPSFSVRDIFAERLPHLRFCGSWVSWVTIVFYSMRILYRNPDEDTCYPSLCKLFKAPSSSVHSAARQRGWREGVRPRYWSSRRGFNLAAGRWWSGSEVEKQLLEAKSRIKSFRHEDIRSTSYWSFFCFSRQNLIRPAQPP